MLTLSDKSAFILSQACTSNLSSNEAEVGPSTLLHGKAHALGTFSTVAAHAASCCQLFLQCVGKVIQEYAMSGIAVLPGAAADVEWGGPRHRAVCIWQGPG